MKKLYIFSIKSFIGPFIVTFLISMFMLIMQFLWKYIDDVMGKGIDYWTIFQLLFYASMSLIPLALPLAILLSSIMTLGNLAENNELTALKAAGLSLYKILKPLTYVVIIISIATFYFSNYVIPVATLKWRAIIYDIQETKIAALITPGVYSKQIDGLSIKIKEGSQSKFKDIVIHDHTSNNVLKTIKAENGEILKSQNGSEIILFLKNGTISEELKFKSRFNLESENINTDSDYFPSRRSSFETATYKIEVTGFNMNKTDEDLFENSHQMMNVFQINKTLDSINKNTNNLIKNFSSNLMNDQAYFLAIEKSKNKLENKQRKEELNATLREANRTLIDTTILIDSITNKSKQQAIEFSLSKLRDKKSNIDAQLNYIRIQEENVARYKIEFHRKFALSATVIVLFFVGAPLGAIVRKGGFGAPVVIASLLFMIYFVLISIGESLASGFIVPPFVGMWFPTLILSPFAFILMNSAAKDSKVFDKEAWGKFFKKIKK